MNNRKIRYIIFFSLLFLFVFNFVLAEDGITPPKPLGQLDKFYQQISDKIIRIISPMKQSLMKKVKEGIKQETKEQIQEKEGLIKRWLNPLKIKIQQGSRVLRERLEQGINWVKSLFGQERSEGQD